MSSHVGASGVSGSGRAGDHVCEDTSEEINDNSAAYTTCRAAGQRLRDTGPAGEERSSSLEQLVRPPLPGRKAHRKTHRGRWREGIREREEAEHGAEKERRRGRQRCTPRIETNAEGSPFRQGQDGVETFSGSNSDIQSSEVLEAGEGSNFRMGQSKANTSTLSLNAESSQPPVSARCSAPLHPSIQNRSASLSSRTSAEELHHHPCASSWESDPFWAAVGTGARAGTSSQNQHPQTPLPSASSSEQDEEGEEEEEKREGEDDDVAGGGVMEVTGQSMTSVAARPCAPLGERRMIKREKNRMKYLRRRQRRRETWRGQLQETQQVNHANVVALMCVFTDAYVRFPSYSLSYHFIHACKRAHACAVFINSLTQRASPRPCQPPAHLNSRCLCGFK